MNKIANNISITSTTRRRKLKGGAVATYPQWYCEYKDPITGKRRPPRLQPEKGRRGIPDRSAPEGRRRQLCRRTHRADRRPGYRSLACRQGRQGEALDAERLQGGGERRHPWAAADRHQAGTRRLHRERHRAEGCPLHQAARPRQADRPDHSDDPHLAPHHRGAVRNLHGEPGEEPPEVDPGARRGGLHASVRPRCRPGCLAPVTNRRRRS